MRLVWTVIAAVGIVCGAGVAVADIVVDQIYDDVTTGESNAFAGNWRGQLFTVGVPGVLDSIDIKVKKQGTMIPNTAPMIVGINEVSGGVPTTQLAAVSVPQSSISTNSSFHTIDFSGFAIPIDAGQQLAIVMRGPGLSTGAYDWALTNPGGYSGGHALFSSNSGGSWTQFTDRDFHFRTFVAVPEPAAIGWLIAFAMGIGVASRRARMHRKNTCQSGPSAHRAGGAQSHKTIGDGVRGSWGRVCR